MAADPADYRHSLDFATPHEQCVATPDGAQLGQSSLATVRAGPRERRAAIGIVALSAVVFCALVPFVGVRLANEPAFIAAYEAALVINDAMTFVLLFGQFHWLRSRAVLALALGYLFNAFIMIPHALTFPGLFTAAGLLGAQSQSTGWLYMFWHGGFSVFVMAYAVLAERGGTIGHRAVAASILCVAALVVGLTVLATAGQGLLPTVIVDGAYTSEMTLVISIVWLLGLAALVLLWRKGRRTTLDVWLMVVMCAWLFDVALSAVLDRARFDIGWYGGRVYGLLAASVVLGALLLETIRLQGRLAAAQGALEDHTRALEDKVRERTTELQRSNASLTAEIAERERAQAQLVQAQKMDAIGRLTGGMAHDFNNLLGVVIGNLDLLRANPGAADADALAQDALDAAVRGADLTHRLLAFARQQPLQPQSVDINALVAGIMKLLSRTLGENIAIVLDLSDDIWTAVVDRAQLEAALTNLATNARDAMPRGGRLTVVTANRQLDADYARLHTDVVPGDYAMIETSDTGSGMSRDVAAKIFEPFFTTKEIGKGTGLGLAMVFGFIKQSGGHINVYSEVGIGTTFRLYLPRSHADAAIASPEPTRALEGGNGETVLVVEDNEGMRRIATRQLRSLGYRVIEAENTDTTLAVLARERVDLLFTDVIMPGAATGIDMARIALTRWPALRVVLTSGFVASSFQDELGTLPSVRLLTKPYRKEDLARIVREALGTAGKGD
jgi:signal transduction histidine kinase